MLTSEKRQPALSDLDPMPFGKHQDEPMQDVPANYLLWLWKEMKDQGYDRNVFRPGLPSHFAQKAKLANYIWNRRKDIERETGEAL